MEEKRIPCLADRDEAFVWTNVEDGVKIIGYRGVLDLLRIPDTLDGKPVTELGCAGDEDKDDGNSVGRVLIPKSVRRIDPNALADGQESYYFNHSSGWIRAFALEEEHPFLRVEGNLLLGEGGKRVITCLDQTVTEVVIPDGVTVIGAKAFYRKEKLTKVVFPASLERVEEKAFWNCPIKEITLPDGLKEVGYNAFTGESGWGKKPLNLTAPPALEKLSYCYRVVWSGLESHPNFTVRDNLILSADGKRLFTHLGDAVPADLAIPEGVEEILPRAFVQVGDVKKLTLPNSLKVIRAHAFGSTKVKTLRIPAGLEDIEDEGFDYDKLGSVLVDKKNTHLYTDKTCLFRRLPEGKLQLLCCFRAKQEEYEVPEGTVEILPYAFTGCSELKKLTLPDSLEIYHEACANAETKLSPLPAGLKKLHLNTNSAKLSKFEVQPGGRFIKEDGVLYEQTDEGFILLRSPKGRDLIQIKEGTIALAPRALHGKYGKVVFPSSLRRIENDAFRYTDVEAVELAEGLEHIGCGAFARCKIKTVTIPASVRYIAPTAFESGLLEEYVVAEGNAYYVARDKALYSIDGKILYDVPANGEYSEFVVPDTVEDICVAFCNCARIKAIRLPAGVRYLWGCSMVGCKKLRHLYLAGVPEFMSMSCMDYDFDITIHADAHPVLFDFVQQMQDRSGGRCKLKLALPGMEDLPKLCKEFSLMPNGEGLTIVKNLSKAEHVTVPEKVGDYPVTAIGPHAFSDEYGEKRLKTVTLPGSVTVIGDHAFENCQGLTTVYMAPGLKKVGDSAFRNCYAIRELNFPEGLEEIGPCALFGLQVLERISFPASLEYISPHVFASRTFGSSDFTHKDLYLQDNTLYQTVPGSYADRFLRAYERSGFGTQPPLKVVCALPDSAPASEEEQKALEYLDYETTAEGTVSVFFKKGLSEEGVVGVIPETLMGLPVTQLTGLEDISVNLKRIVVPAGVTAMHGLYYLTFYYSSWGVEPNFRMNGIDVHPDNPAYWSDGQALYTKDRATLIHLMDYQATEYTVHPDTCVIAEGAFGKMKNLKKLVLPVGLKEICGRAFEGCPLEEIEGVETVEKIADGALSGTPWFQNQNTLISGSVLTKYAAVDAESYTVPDGITEIAPQAFAPDSGEDKLQEIILPDSVTTLGRYAFANRKKLKHLRLGRGLTAIGNAALNNCLAIESLHIPAGVEIIDVNALPADEEHWRSTTPCAFANITVDPDNAHFMAVDGVLYSKDGGTLLKFPPYHPATEFVVPDGVHTIGPAAFKKAKALRAVTLPASVKTLADSAFAACEALEEIDLSAVNKLETSVFWGCTALTRIALNVEEVPARAASECTGLVSVSLNGVRVVGDYAFSGCTALKSVTLPEGLVYVGENAFASCGLKQVVVPKTVQKVGDESFSGCPDITIYDTIDPDAKPAEQHKDDVNGSPNSLVGFMGIGKSHAMWQCAANHAWVDHEITVRSAETGEIKYKVPMYSDPKQRKYYCLLTSSWGKNGTFHFAALDNFFSEIKGVPNKMRVALSRLRWPVDLGEGQRDAYVDYLVRSAKALVIDCIDRGDMETLLMCVPFGILKKNNIDELIEYAVKKQAVEFSAYLMGYKNEHFGGKTASARELTLSDKVTLPWQAPKSGTSKIGRYKGSDLEVEFPTEFKGKPVTGIAGTTKKPPENYKALVSVVIPEGYTTIGDYAFCGCENLESVTLPSTLESIGRAAFAGCKKLKEIILPDSLKELEPECFMDCAAAATLRLSNKLKRIPGDAFYGCRALTEVDLPASVVALEKDSFGWTNLTSVIVRSRVLNGSGSCFGSIGKVYARADAVIHVYDIHRRHMHLLDENGQPTDASVPSPFQTMEVDALEFADNIFVTTGLSAAANEEVTRVITEKGGMVKDSVVLDTYCLIVDESYDHATTKYTRALELNEQGKNILIIGLKRFKELI